MIALAQRAWGWLTGLRLSAPWLVAAALALFGLVQTVRIEGLRIWPLHITGLKAERDDAIAVVAKVKKAQPEAAQAQAAVNHAPAAISAQIAETSNVEAQDYYARGRAAGLAYADAHRVRQACLAGEPSGTGVPGADRAAEVDDRSGGSAGMVAVSQADYDLLTSNNNRLAKVRDDAQALIAAGVAIPSK